MLQIRNIKLNVSYTQKDLIRACEKVLRKRPLPDVRILRRSLDSRKKEHIFYLVSAGVFGLSEAEEKKIVRMVNNNNVMLTDEKKYVFPYKSKSLETDQRPVIIGTGPAGYYAGREHADLRKSLEQLSEFRGYFSGYGCGISAFS